MVAAPYKKWWINDWTHRSRTGAKLVAKQHHFSPIGWLKMMWISMATMYENLCGNCVGRVELTFVWHFISVHLIIFIPLHIGLTIFKIARLWTVKEMSTVSYPQLPHEFLYLSTIILNHLIHKKWHRQ
jgi:hypothetical protein